MAVYLGGQVSQLSIIDDQGWDTGSAVVRWTEGNKQQRLLNDLKTALAGPIAEMIYVGDYDYLRIRSEHAADWQIVQDNLHSLNVPEGKIGTFLETCVAQIYQLLREDHLWSAVADIAEELMLNDEIDGQEVHQQTQFWLRQV